MLTAKSVSSDNELAQIAALSKANLVSNITTETKEREGFVTWYYPLEVLRQLHAIIPSVIVKDHDLVAGYAIVLPLQAVNVYPPLSAVVAHFSQLIYKKKPLLDYRMYVMGQVCVHPDYRGKGAFQRLYQFHRQHFSAKYDLLVTEISSGNSRSLKAHQKMGFVIIDTYRDEVDEWHVVVWDWSLRLFNDIFDPQSDNPGDL